MKFFESTLLHFWVMHCDTDSRVQIDGIGLMKFQEGEVELIFCLIVDDIDERGCNFKAVPSCFVG